MKKICSFDKFGTMIDCSRNAVMNVKTVKRWIDLTSKMGYNMLMLYTEDTYQVDNQPYFGYMRGKYSKEELKEIDDYAFRQGMEVIPCIQTLAHLNAALRWPAYERIKDCNDILLVGDEKTYKLIEDMFITIAECFRTKTVHIGMDEAFMLGRGKFFDKNGNVDSYEILLSHLNRVADIAKKYGFELIMWGDMFFRLAGEDYYSGENISYAVKKRIPENVNLVYWDYYSTDLKHYENQIKSHKQAKDDIWFAGGLWTWTGFVPHNGYSIDAAKAAFSACKNEKIKYCILTLWGDNGAECSKFSILPSLYYAAELAYGNEDVKTVKKGFKEMFGIDFDDFMAIDISETYNEGVSNTNNPEKYLLYNDCLLGLFDGKIQDNMPEKYKNCAQKLEKLIDLPQYGMLFNTVKCLCDVLTLKCEIGLNIRKTYKSSDKYEMEKFLPIFDELMNRIDLFYNAFEYQWMDENKPHGFDVQDIRIGGLKQRILHVKDRIKKYCNGQIDKIEELEEELLDVTGGGDRLNSNPICFNAWDKNVSANSI